MSNLEKKTKIIFYAAGGLLVCALMVFAAWMGKPKTPVTVDNAPVMTQPDVQVVYRDVNQLIPVEKMITAEIIQDGLNDMGFLVTQEYYFTEVMSFSSVKQFFGMDLPFTESNYLASYDGTILAGIDFTKIQVEKREEEKKILLTLPEATMQSVDVDPDSFVLYSEKDGLGNHISVKDYNRSLSELEKNAAQKALDRGVLEKANENAQQVVRNFVGGLVDLREYQLNFV